MLISFFFFFFFFFFLFLSSLSQSAEKFASLGPIGAITASALSTQLTPEQEFSNQITILFVWYSYLESFAQLHRNQALTQLCQGLHKTGAAVEAVNCDAVATILEGVVKKGNDIHSDFKSLGFFLLIIFSYLHLRTSMCQSAMRTDSSPRS